ncbi:MAG: polysaccharide ABC transporter ATP-binding protein [Planctomycetaceae bacterium]|nr:polysaccharide ABC transporter ATP-binding protein [Planctomycetaceae bacterium]
MQMDENTPLAISVENVSKKFRLGTFGEHHRLTEAISDGFKALLSGNFKTLTGDTREFWALENISFKVLKGEVVGIIGHNGAGKSTLLKILSRIVTPTKGRIGVRGRIGSLLEVGTGFHPELTGRENIYLNGAILGMKRSEIRNRFDQIVEFAEVGQFLDTPVKRYSNGMIVRLGFSVAAHMEPDVLIIDEVLSVGDQSFQDRCMGKATELGNQGRAILVVSHNLAAISNICCRALLMDHGSIVLDGPPKQVIEHYLKGMQVDTGKVVWEPATAPASSQIRLHSIGVRNVHSLTSNNQVDIDQPIAIEIEYEVLCEGAINTVQLHLKDENGVFVLSSANAPSMNLAIDQTYGKPLPLGFYRAECVLPANFLNDSRYVLNLFLGPEIGKPTIQCHNVLAFRVLDTGAMRKEYLGSWYGPAIRPRLAWSTCSIR